MVANACEPALPVDTALLCPQKVQICCAAHECVAALAPPGWVLSSLQFLAEHLAQHSSQAYCCVGTQTFCTLCCCSWRDRWQQMDVFHRWLVAAQHRHAMRFMTAAAYEHRYLTLGRASIAAWKGGVQHNHRVSDGPSRVTA